MTGRKITTLWAVIAEHENGDDGILAGVIPMLGATPLVVGYESNLESILPIARKAVKMAKEAGVKSVKLVKFTVREDIEDIA